MKRKHDVASWRQQQLVRLALRHSETTKADCAVLAEIVQRYHGEYGNGWASYEMLIEEAGVTRATVKRARRKLERLGFITVLVTGRKGRSTVYLPNFDLVPEKGIKPDPISKGVKDEPVKDSLGIKLDPENDLLGVKDDPPSYLQLPVYKTGILESNIDPAAPPMAGLPAASASAHGEGKFDQLYKAYGHRRGRADARKAYEALAPTDEAHADMLAAAAAWREAWARQGNPDAPRFTLAKWLERECYHEDPPTGFATTQRRQRAGADGGNTLISYRRDAHGITVLRQGGDAEKILDPARIEAVIREAEERGIESDNGTFVMVKR
ncbi:helix-turn-helix domain-containing protein [Brucellaceae bacterium VT-16-1752]|nr:helix-turn-helix domain-containing protein [Brucellaceae bacterium VT-16-1752]